MRAASLEPTSDGLPGTAAVWVGPFLILAAVAITLAIRWDEIPARIVAHWGPSGADRWVAKSWRSIFGVLIIGTWSEALVAGIGVAIANGARGASGGWRASNRRISLGLLLAVAYIVALMLSDIALAPAFGNPAEIPVSPWIPAAALLSAIAIGFWRLVRTRNEPDLEPEPTPDDKWTWGEFYYNPDDPAITVPKRSGVGYTLNFASPYSWAIGGIILLLPVVIVIFAV